MRPLLLTKKKCGINSWVTLATQLLIPSRANPTNSTALRYVVAFRYVTIRFSFVSFRYVGVRYIISSHFFFIPNPFYFICINYKSTSVFSIATFRYFVRFRNAFRYVFLLTEAVVVVVVPTSTPGHHAEISCPWVRGEGVMLPALACHQTKGIALGEEKTYCATTITQDTQQGYAFRWRCSTQLENSQEVSYGSVECFHLS